MNLSAIPLESRLEAFESIAVTADQDGRVWLLVSTDSGFESLTALYYTRVTASFDPL